MRVKHEYNRRGALTYLAAWDVHRATLFGRCEISGSLREVQAAQLTKGRDFQFPE